MITFRSTLVSLASIVLLNGPGYILHASESQPTDQTTSIEKNEHKEAENHGSNVHFNKGQALRFDKTIKVPKSLVSKIESLYVQHFRVVRQESPLTDEEVLVNIPRRYLTVFVEVFDPKKKSLDHNTRYQLFKRSGSIDLSKDVISNSGSFYFKVKAQLSGAKDPIDQSMISVYFVSQKKARKVGSENYGTGCDRWLDSSTLYRETLSTGGLQLHVKDQRYITIIGGTFYFVYFQDGNLYLSTLTVDDSRYPELNCKGKRVARNG